MVSRPLRMTLAAASDSAKACARAPPTHDAPPTRPAYGLAQRRTPASLASRLHTAPRFAQPLACMLAAPHSVLWTRASAGRRKREVGSGPGTRRNPTELRLYINKGLRGLVFQRIAQRPLATLAHDTRSMLPYIPSPSSPDRVTAHAALRSRIAPRPRISTRNVPTLFDAPSASPTATSRALVTPPICMHRSRRPPAERAAV